MEDPITMRHLRAVTEPAQSLGQSPQISWRLLKKSPLRHHKAWEDLHNLIGGPQEIAIEATQSLGRSPQLNWRSPRNLLSHLGFQEPKSNKLNELSPPNLRGELKPMQWQEHKCSNPSISNSNKATNAYRGIREEEQRRRITKPYKI
jgi:hypothetical protein